MGPHEGREHLLLGQRETLKISVGDDVLPVPVVVVVGDVETYLVQVRGPGQELPRAAVSQSPAVRHLGEQRQARLLHPRRLLPVDVGAIRQGLDPPLAHVLVADPAEKVVEQALAQSPVRASHDVDAERFEQGRQDGGAPRNGRPAPRVQPLELQPADASRLQQGLAQPAERRGRDPLPAPSIGADEAVDGPDGPRGPDRLLPVERAEALGDRLELLQGGELGPAPALRGEPAVAEVGPAEGDAAHVEALHREGRLLAHDQLGAPAADVDDQPPASGSGQGSRHPEEDQAGLLDAGDGLYRVSQGPLRVDQELAGVDRRPQGVGAHRAHVARVHVAQPLSEPPKALDGAVARFGAEAAVGVEAGSELHHLAQAIDEDRLAALGAGDEHVEAV